MPQDKLSKHIETLDPVRDHQEIARLLGVYLFPWELERALEFALFRTYAVPSISALLVKTGEFARRPRKRYDDTELIMYEMLENGYDSERGRRALRRMNAMHNRFDISNDDFLYVLTTFIYEPVRWIERIGWRKLTEKEKLAFFHYNRQVGLRMGIKDIPEDYHVFEQFNRDYERAHFHYAESNRIIGKKTVDLLLSFYLPRFLWPLGRPLIHSLMDEPLLDAMGFKHSPRWLCAFTAGLLRFRAWCIGYLPRRNKPRLGTKRKRPTYPEGYEIEELGTFR